MASEKIFEFSFFKFSLSFAMATNKNQRYLFSRFQKIVLKENKKVALRYEKY